MFCPEECVLSVFLSSAEAEASSVRVVGGFLCPAPDSYLARREKLVLGKPLPYAVRARCLSLMLSSPKAAGVIFDAELSRVFLLALVPQLRCKGLERVAPLRRLWGGERADCSASEQALYMGCFAVAPKVCPP